MKKHIESCKILTQIPFFQLKLTYTINGANRQTEFAVVSLNQRKKDGQIDRTYFLFFDQRPLVNIKDKEIIPLKYE